MKFWKTKDDFKDNYITNNKVYFYYSFIIIKLYFLLFSLILIISLNKKVILYENYNKFNNENLINKYSKNKIKTDVSFNNLNKKCYSSPDNSIKKILHLIITRFLIDFYRKYDFRKKIYKEDYILNGIRVMEKYLFPSLESQSCKDFTWILIVGNKANITFVNSLIKFNNTLNMKVIYEKDFKNYVRNKTKDIDIFITTRIDYDDRIYYDAVNDVRKAINIKWPIILHGYRRGFYYFEKDDKYYDFYNSYNNNGAMSTFVSLITNLKKVNGIYTIHNLGSHINVRKNLLKNFKSFGIKKLNYEPAIFDSGEPKFVWVRQKYSCSKTRQFSNLKASKNFSLIKFYGN